MLFGYKNIRFHGGMTLCGREARGLAHSKDEHVQNDCFIVD
jgi:hypothetical protein